ncbi:hypothetical protein FACS189451_12170 [Bacteroidia bacterium]|nr:hypothetical protein FACS189451_12170 [Bacteroidia bacterium]
MAKKAETKKLVVLQTFIDKNDKTTRYYEGTEVEFETERANDVVERGLAKVVEPVIEG